MHRVADAIRDVTVRVQQAIDSGHRSRRLDADDLVEVLLSIADRLDPPLGDVEPDAACPACGSVGPARVVWNQDEPIRRCRSCGGDLPSG